MSLLGRDGSSLLSSVRPLLDWSSFDARRLARLDSILGTVDDDLFPGGIIPRLISGEMHYYAVAASHSQRQRLSSLLRASVGPTITDFSAQLVSFNAWDDLEALLIDNGYPLGFRFTAGADTVRGQYASNLSKGCGISSVKERQSPPTNPGPPSRNCGGSSCPWLHTIEQAPRRPYNSCGTTCDCMPSTSPP